MLTNHDGLNCFIEYLHRKLLTDNFLSYDIESAHLILNLHIKTIHFLFYYLYLILAKND